MNQKAIALIPARGGSKSIPRKNLRLIAGKPMIAHTILDAIASSLIDRVIVTTDDNEIAEVARQFGAEVPFIRPRDISGDLSLDIEFHQHALNWLKDHESYVPHLVVNLRPTHPVRKLETIDRAIAALAATIEADSLRSVRLAEETPYKMWTINKDGYLTPIAKLSSMRESYNMPRQLLPLAYWQDGYIDIVRTSVIFEKNSTSGDRILSFVIDEESVDIDYEESIAVAEKLLSRKSETLSITGKVIRYPS